MDLALTNPGGSADSTVVKLDRFHLLLGRNPVDASMVLRTPVSDPDVDLRVKGKVDLADVRRTMKLEGIDQLTGTVAADAAVRTRMSFVDKKQYDKVAASGSVDVGDLTVKGKTLPHPLTIQQASLTLAPERAQLKSFAGTIGSSDLQASGTIENLLVLRLPGRHAARDRDGAEQPVQPGRMAVGRGRPAGHPGAAQDRLRAGRHRGRADVRQAQDDQRARPAPREGPARHAGGLPDEHAGRRDRGDRLLRDDQPGQADVRRRPQDDQGGHPVGVPGVHDGADAGSGRQVRHRDRVHRPAPERRAWART